VGEGVNKLEVPTSMDKAARSPVKEMIATIESNIHQTSTEGTEAKKVNARKWVRKRSGLYGWVKVKPEKPSTKSGAKCGPKLSRAKTVCDRKENTQSVCLTSKNSPLFRKRIPA
jgi:hypothetical protein